MPSCPKAMPSQLPGQDPHLASISDSNGKPVERRTGIPILTSEGLVGHQLVVRDYWVAGDSLTYGDVVAVTGESGVVGSPSVSKVFGGVGQSSTIGIIHIPSSQSVGDMEARMNKFVPVVNHGVARTLAASQIWIGHSVTPDFSLHAKAQNEAATRITKLTERVGGLTQ